MATSKSRTGPAAMQELHRRFEKLLSIKDGPRLRRIEFAINEGLMRPGTRHGVMSNLAGALHCANLARVYLGEGGEHLPLEEPEHALVYLAKVAADLEEVLHNVALELDKLDARSAA